MVGENLITNCDECGKEIQVHPTNWQQKNRRVCIACQKKAESLTFDQEVFGVVGTAGQMEQDEIDEYYAKQKIKRGD